MGLINWKIKPEYVEEKKAEIEFMLARKPEISIALSKDLAELVKMGIDVHVNAKLTITSKSREVIVKDKQFGYLNHSGDDAIEYDEITNNTEIIAKEYSITVDEVSGKVHIACDMGDSQSIIQGIIGGYIAKPKNRTAPSGAHFDHQVEQKEGQLKRAKFSGYIYFENLPVDIMGKPVTKEEAENSNPQIEMELSKEEKDASENKQSKPKQEDILELPEFDVLKVTKKGQLKPPRGSSRTQRNEWWSELRRLYPNSFDTGGNWLGYVDVVDGEPIMETAPDVNKKVDNVDQVPGLLNAVGTDNRMTNMTDKKIRGGYILGALIKGKGFSTLWTPTAIGDEAGSALVICNKPRTGKFMLAGLARNSSFAKKVHGYDLVDVMTFHQKYFTEDTLVYYVCNAVTALKELGTQEKDIEDIKQNSA